ncbi:hypothetical protein CAAN1_18S02784 [[Candida] anglica]|uniref:Fe2OG dioxygenase domain-containing protein n=1 Tax=[Candida] anglica TaxID=148631 RepID=A0ABP0ER01_9ASCO
MKANKFEFPNSFTALPINFQKSFYKPQPETIVDDQIITIENFFSEEVCNDLIKAVEKSPAINLETTPLIKSREYAARFNDRCSTTDFDATKSLWSYLQQVLLNDVGYEDEDLDSIKETFKNAIFLNPQLRMYRYRKGHHFGKHYDESVVCPLEESSNPPKGRTKWTLLIYLTGGDEFVGGGTIFHPDYRGVKPLNIHPTKGMALLHKHGDDCLKHEAEIVHKGEKWVLRSDVVYKK